MFTALNASFSDQEGGSHKENIVTSFDAVEEDDRKEETRVFTVYKSVLEKLALKRSQEAKADLVSLLNNKIFKKVDKKSNQLRQLYYAVLKNLGFISANEQNSQEAVVYYRQALALCDQDVSLWYDFGAEAFKSNDILLARHAFEEGLSLSPENFLCLDKLIAVYFILGDFPNCLNKIRQALIKRPSHERSIILKNVIFERCPYLKAGYSSLFDELNISDTYSEEQYNKMVARLDEITEKIYTNCLPDKTVDSYCPKTNLKGNPLSWSSLVQSLLILKIELEENNISLIHPINLMSSDDELGDEIMEHDQFQDTLVRESATDSDSVSVTRSNLVGYDSSSEVTGDTKVTKNRKRKLVGPANPNNDLIEAKRRSSRLIPGFFIEDPEAFGPLTTRPINIKEQLISFLPDEIRDYYPSKIRRSTILEEKSNTAASDFDVCPRMSDDPDEIEQFLSENDNKSFLAISTQILMQLSKSDVVSSIWTESLTNGFVKLFSIWHEHQISSDDDELVCNLALLALELSSVCDMLPRKLHLIAHLEYYCNHLDLNIDKNADFCLRFNYFSYKVAENSKNFDRAYFYLSNCKNLAFYKSDNFKILLPNSCDVISRSKILEKLEFCRRTRGLAAIQASFNQGDYCFVIELAKLSNNDQERLAENLDEKCKRLSFLCKSYEKCNKFGTEMFESLIDLLSTLLKSYRNANFEQMTLYFSKFAENLGLIKRCIVSNLELLKISSNKDSNLAIGCLAETVVELILIFMDFSDNAERFSTYKSTKTQNDSVIPESCWFDSFEILYDLSKSYELSRMVKDEQYAKNWWTSRKIVDNSSSGYSFLILVTKSFMIFNFAHEELGKRQMCTKDGGFFLTKFASELRSILRIPEISKNMPSGVNDDTLNCAEQCFYCLYNYPRKRSRCLAEHNAENVPLAWPATFLLFDFVRPEKSPEFDDSPYNSSISSETVILLHRIEDLVPDHLKPDPHLTALVDYIEGKTPAFVPDKTYSNGTNSRNNDINENSSVQNELTIVWDLYHLMADYYSKNKDKDLDKICRYYQLDLCISNDRSDSWAGLALYKQAIIDKNLSSPEFKYSEEGISEIIDTGRSALFCFQKAIDFNAGHVVLLVEYGSLAYTMHSFFNRALRRKSNAKLSSDRKAFLDTKRLEYFRIARQCFEKSENLLRMAANHDFCGKDSWLIHYMLGKIKEKSVQNASPSQFLPHFHRASHLLHVEGAKYPTKIPYTAPKYAYEALEVYFRVYASCLKWLLKQENPTEAELRIIDKYFKLFAHHPIRLRKSFISKNVFECDPDVVDCINDVLDSVESAAVPSKKRLMFQCADTMKILCRKSAHPYYKAYYWLVRFYKSLNDLQTCRYLLLGSEKTNPTVSIPCLFNCRSPQFFEGIWLIPADDISRAGSFSEYLFKILSVLQQILGESEDSEKLFNLCLTLIRKPNQKSQYLRECDRQELSQMYFLNCEQTIVRSFSKNVTKESKARICLQAYSIYQRLERLKYEKHAAHFFSRVLKQCFAMIVGVQEIGNVPKERVLKFYCDLRRMVERQVQPPSSFVKSSLHQSTMGAPSGSAMTPKISIPSSSSTAKNVPVNSASAVSPPKVVESSTSKLSPDVIVVKHSVDKILTSNKPSNSQPVKLSAAISNAKSLASAGDQQVKTNPAYQKVVNMSNNPNVKAGKSEISGKATMPPVRTECSKTNASLQLAKRKSQEQPSSSSSSMNRPIAPPPTVLSSFQQNLLRQNSIESILKSAMASSTPPRSPTTDSPSTSYNLLANLKSNQDFNAALQLLNRLAPQQQLQYLKIAAATQRATQPKSSALPQINSVNPSAGTSSSNQSAPQDRAPNLGCDKFKLGPSFRQ